MSHYHFSVAVTTDEVKRWGLFTTLPVRNHAQEYLAHQGSRDFIQEMAAAMGDNVQWKACSQTHGHLVALSLPECLPDRLALISGITDITFLIDDIFENTTDTQREKGTLEGSEEFQSVLEQKGLPRNALAMLPQLKKRFIDYVMTKDASLASWMSQEVTRITAAPPRDRMNYATIDSYLDLRLQDIAIRWYYELCAYGMDLKLTEAEKNQASRPARAMEKASIYANDYYSWAKEKLEQATVAASRDMFNAVAVLMKEHEISEANALDMVREKILECEKEHWAAVADLEATGPISENLYRYLDMTRLCHSGSMLWGAFSDRYNNLGQKHVESNLKTQEIPSMSSDENTLTHRDTPKLLLNGSGTKDEYTPYTSRVHLQDSSSKGEPDPPTNGIHLPDSESANSEVNGRNGDRSCLQNGSCLPHESVGVDLKPGADVVLAPYEYVTSMPSKKVREVVIDGLNRWLGLPEKSLDLIRNIVVMLHTAALMLDDIEDGSNLRRGMPSAHVVYGESQTINSASYVQTRAFAEAARLSNPHALSILCEELENLYTGQSLDLFWKFHIHCPSEKEYLEMVDGKTGGLFRLILRLMQAESPVTKGYGPELKSFITALGRYFQIRDDYQNLASSEYAQQKGFCEDLDEGKMSLPLIHSLQNSSEGEKSQIRGIFKTLAHSGLSPEVKSFIIKHLREKTASLLYVRDRLKELELDLADRLMALEEAFGIRNPLLGGALAKLKV
ncbi:MAG: hypothetical protein LQ344_003651 [Seirophora lacunosa]|nr:MAG: hypothetical protein LQ344_003651 [Seirophora lacunosa]